VLSFGCQNKERKEDLEGKLPSKAEGFGKGNFSKIGVEVAFRATVLDGN
jgi:hypothetical protein